MILGFSGEREFAGCLGASASDACHPTVRKPNASVVRLQTALRGLAQRVGDAKVGDIGAQRPDGLVGPSTARAVNYAVPKYTAAPAVLASGALTRTQIVAFAPQLAAAVEKGPNRAAPSAPSAPLPTYGPPSPIVAPPSVVPAVLPRPPAPVYTRSPGGPMPPYYPPQPSYYPPPSYGPGYGPGGMAPDRASVDTKIYIPAQYEHVQFNPMTLALVLAVGVGTVLVMQRREKA